MNNNKGVALLIVITTVAILSIFMVELTYKTRLYIKVSSSYKESIQAYYLAKSSVNLALTRLAIFNKLKQTKIENFKVPAQFLDIIWSFPLSYPFPIGFGGGDSFNADTDINSFGSFDQKIDSLDNKFNVNMVVLGEEQEKIFLSIVEASYEKLLEEKEDFSSKHSKEDFVILANNIIDWIDADNNSKNGGDENAYYLNNALDYKPRNGPIPDILELKMVDTMTDELFDIFTTNINIFASNLNPNDSGIEIWKLLLPEVPIDELKKILKEKELYGLPFSSEEEIKTWLYEVFAIKSDAFNPSKLSLSFERESFKITARGIVGRTQRSVTCYISNIYKYLNSFGFLNKKKEDKNKKHSIIPEIILWELE